MSTSAKNILIVTHHYPPHITGVGFVAQNHAERFAALGHKVSVITSNTAKNEKSYFAKGVDVIRIKAWNISESWSAPFPIFSPMLIFTLLKHIRKVDIVHIHDAFYVSSFFAALIAKIYRKPIVLTQHVAMIAHPSRTIVAIQKIVYATTGAFIFKLSNTIITFNDRVKNFLIQKGVPLKKMVELSNGVDVNIFHPVTVDQKINIRKELGVSLEKKILLFVGRFVQKKGFWKVLAARSNDYQIVCVGGEAPKEDFGDDIVFLGKLDQKELPRIYQMADIFILPSESEGFPLSIQEAMISGLPIITTDDPGYGCYNLDKKLISLIDHADDNALREAIYKIYRDEDQLKKMSVYSEEYAKRHFSWPVVIDELNTIYNSFLIKKNNLQHVCMVTPYFYPKIGGLETIAYTVAKDLHEKKDYKVTIITSNHKGRGYIRETIDEMVVHRLPILFTASNTPINPFWYWRIKKILKREKPDLVNVHSPVPFIADIATYAAGKIPVILSYHSGSMLKNKWPIDLFILIYERLFLRIIFRKARAIVAYSPEFIKRELAAFAYKTHVIPPGVHLNEFIPTPLPLKQKVVTFVGRIGYHTEWKGVSVLLEAFALIVKKHPDARLNLVGEGDAVDHYIRMAHKLHISDHVSFCGAKTGAALHEAYRNTNVIVLPSTSNAESFGIVLLEGMASGRPIVGSNIGGIPQLIDDKKNGFLVTPGKPQTLASALKRILTDRTIAKQFARESIAKAKQFSWETQIEKYRKLFHEVIKFNKAKKIAIISDAVYPFNKGGKEKRIYDISTRLIAQGFNVTIYCMRWWKGSKTIKRDGVIYQAISPYYPLYKGNRRSIKQAILFSLHCFKLFNKDFDIAEVDHIPHLVLFVMKIVCFLNRKRMVATWHEVWGRRYWKQYLGFGGSIAYWIEKISIRLPDTIISVSDHTTAALSIVLKNSQKIVTVPNGLDITQITNNISVKSGADLIFAGRLLAHKNIDVLLHSVHVLVQKKSNLSLLIIGEGPERKKLETLTKELGLQKNVFFQDFFENHNDLYASLRASKVFVLPSTREGFGIVVLEANACGLPVVTINHPENAAKELITDQGNGVLTLLDQGKIARAIENALEMKKNQWNMMPYIEKYNWDNLIADIVSVYNE